MNISIKSHPDSQIKTECVQFFEEEKERKNHEQRVEIQNTTLNLHSGMVEGVQLQEYFCLDMQEKKSMNEEYESEINKFRRESSNSDSRFVSP